MRKQYITAALMGVVMLAAVGAPQLGIVERAEAGHCDSYPEGCDDEDEDCVTSPFISVALACAYAYAHAFDRNDDPNTGWNLRVKGEASGWSPADIPGQVIGLTTEHAPDGCVYVGSWGCEVNFPHVDTTATSFTVTASSCVGLQDVMLHILEEMDWDVSDIDRIWKALEDYDIEDGTICAHAQATATTQF